MKNKILIFTVFFFSTIYSQNSTYNNVYGLKLLSFDYKYNENFIGLSLPLISGSGVSERFTGIDIGFFLSGCSKILYYPKFRIDNFDAPRVYKFNGLAISGLINSMWEMNGVSITPGLTSADNLNGISFSGLSVIENFNGFSTSWLIFVCEKAKGFSFSGLVSGGDEFTGVSLSLLVSGAKYFKGLSIGSLSLVEEEMIGLQIGIVNYAENLKGIQIGILNIAKNAFIPYTIGLNWNF